MGGGIQGGDCLFYGSQLTVLRNFPWLCTQGSFQVGSGDHMECQESNPVDLMQYKYPTHCTISPLPVFSYSVSLFTVLMVSFEVQVFTFEVRSVNQFLFCV